MNAPQTKLHATLAPPAMERFHEVPDAAAILISKAGVYRQVKVFRRGNEVYAGHGTGFIRLFGHGSTSTPTIRLREVPEDDRRRRQGHPFVNACLPLLREGRQDMTPFVRQPTNWPLVAFWVLLGVTGLPAFVCASYALYRAMEALFG